MTGTGHTVPASASQPAPVLEVVGGSVGHVYVTREAADVLAPSVGALLPALVAVVAEHRATGAEQSDHRRNGQRPACRPDDIRAGRRPPRRRRRGRMSLGPTVVVAGLTRT